MKQLLTDCNERLWLFYFQWKCAKTYLNFSRNTRLFRNFDSLPKLCYIPSLVGFHACVHASVRIRLVTHPVHATVVSFCQANWRCEPRHVLQRPRENNTCLHTAGSHSPTTRCHCPRGTSASPFLAFSPSRPLPLSTLFYISSSSSFSFLPSSFSSLLSLYPRGHLFLGSLFFDVFFLSFFLFFLLFCFGWYGEVGRSVARTTSHYYRATDVPWIITSGLVALNALNDLSFWGGRGGASSWKRWTFRFVWCDMGKGLGRDFYFRVREDFCDLFLKDVYIYIYIYLLIST